MTKGEERKAYEISPEERRLMVEAGVQFYLKSKAEFGADWDPSLFYNDERFKNLPEQVQAELRAEIEKQEKGGEVAPQASKAKQAPEPKSKKKKEREKKKTNKKLSAEEIIALQGEALDTALARVSSKEARRMAEVFEKANDTVRYFKALKRAWKTFDKQNKKGFSELTKALVKKIAENNGLIEAKKFIQDKVRPVNSDLANELALSFATPAPAADKKAPVAPKEPKVTKADKTSQRKEPELEEYDQTATERMLASMEDSLLVDKADKLIDEFPEESGHSLYEEVLDEIAFREKNKEDEVADAKAKYPGKFKEQSRAAKDVKEEQEKAERLKVYAGDQEAVERLEPGSYENAKSALEGLGVDITNPEKSLKEKEKYLEKIAADLQKQIESATQEDCARILGTRREQGALDASIDAYLESLSVDEIKDIAVESHGIDKDEWKEIFKPLFDGLDRLVNLAQEKREELRAKVKKHRAEQGKVKGLDPDVERARAEGIVREVEERRVAGAVRAAEFQGEYVPVYDSPTTEDRKKIDEQVKFITDRIDQRAKELNVPPERIARFNYESAIERGEYYLLDQMAKQPKRRWFLLKRDGIAAREAVGKYLPEFAKEAGMASDDVLNRLDELVKEIGDARRQAGGEYVYENLDPKGRFKSGEDVLARLKLEDIGQKVQLPKKDEAEARFADLLDFFEAARKMQKKIIEKISKDSEARRAQREDERLTAEQEVFDRAVASFIRGREEAAAQTPDVKYPGEFKFAGALRGGEDAIFALLDPDADARKRRDIVKFGIPAWRATAEHFLPKFAHEVGLNEQEFRQKLDKIIADLQKRRKKEGRHFQYQHIDPTGAQIREKEIVSDWPLKKLLKAMDLPKDLERAVVEALDYFDALQDLRKRLKQSLRDQRVQAKGEQAERVREMREDREKRLPSFAGEVELDALLWASDKNWWGKDEGSWESARQAVVLYQREYFGKEQWSDERKAALREIMRMVWARRDFAVAKKAVGAVGLDSRAALELLKFAGVEVGRIIPLVPPRRKPGAIHVNISGEEGVVSGASYHKKVKDARKVGKIYDPSDANNNVANYIKERDRTLSFDHHNAGISLPDVASAQYLFETLEFLGFFTAKNEHFKKEFAEKFGYSADTLRKALELVMYDDTKSHPAWKDRDSAYWKGPWQRSLLAIAARANFKSIVAYVKDHPDTDFTEEISEADAQKYGFVQKDGRSLVEKNEETLELAKKHWAELTERGYSVYQEEIGGELRELSRYYLVEAENSRLGKVKIVFVEAGAPNKGGYRGGGFPGGIDHLRGVGGSDILYLIYNPPYEIQRKDGRTEPRGERIFATHTDRDLPEDLFPGGARLRMRMWNYTGRGLEKKASVRAIFEALGVAPEELQNNKALIKAIALEEYDPEKPLTPEEVGLDAEKAKFLRETLIKELVEKYADEFAKEYPNMAKRGRERLIENAEDYVKDKGEEELEKKFQRALHARMQRAIAKQRG